MKQIGIDITKLNTKKAKTIYKKLLLQNSIPGRHRLLVYGKRLFDDLKMDYFLSTGTILGIYRDGCLIEHDDDVDFTFCAEELLPNYDIIKNRLLNDGFLVRARFKKGRIIAFREGCQLAIAGFYQDGEFRCRNSWRIPGKFYDQAERIKYEGEYYRTHAPIEDYLAWVFANWKVPDKNKGWHEQSRR